MLIEAITSLLGHKEGLSFQCGEVRSVDASKKTISVQSRISGDIISNIPLEPAIFQQYIPVVGQQVILYRIGSFFTGVLAFLGSRRFRRPLQAGEFLIEGIGGGRAFFDRGGNVHLSDKTMSNVLELLSSVGVQFVGDAVSIEVKQIAKITIKDDEVRVKKIAEVGDVATAEVIIKDGQVTVDSLLVELGKAPTTGAAVVSLSQVPGDYSYDLITGRPIPGSAQIKGNP